MEQPNAPQPEKKASKIGQAIRSAIGGAAMLGAVGATELPIENPHFNNAAEAHEAFNADKEAEAFLNRIASMQPGISDRRGMRMLQTIIEENLNAFALALQTRTPNFSAQGNVSISGQISPQSLENAKQVLLPKILVRSGANNPALEILKGIVSEQDAPPADKEQLRRFLGN